MPPKIQCFIWTLLHGKIFTNLQRNIRGFSSNSNCPRCEGACEDIEHLLRGCPIFGFIWDSFSQGAGFVRLSRPILADWLMINLKNNRVNTDLGPNYLLFAVTLWFIWK
ncbi:hypothetical protein ACOSQ3_032630 [Xanthoceras sorbifolium]